MSEAEPACSQRLRRGTFRSATSFDIAHRRPCKFCFPTGEITVDEDQLLTGGKDSEVVHREMGTGEVEAPAEKGRTHSKLYHKLGQEDVTDWDDLDLGQSQEVS